MGGPAAGKVRSSERRNPAAQHLGRTAFRCFGRLQRAFPQSPALAGRVAVQSPAGGRFLGRDGARATRPCRRPAAARRRGAPCRTTTHRSNGKVEGGGNLGRDEGADFFDGVRKVDVVVDAVPDVSPAPNPASRGDWYALPLQDASDRVERHTLRQPSGGCTSGSVFGLKRAFGLGQTPANNSLGTATTIVRLK
jgi:hypothetical protein